MSGLYEPGDFEPTADDWVVAAEAFVRWAYLGEIRLRTHDVGLALRRLERAGLIVHPDTHDELANDYAQKLQRVEQAADELTQRLHGDEE